MHFRSGNPAILHIPAPVLGLIRCHMKIIDNFLDPADLQDFKNIILSANFPWYLNHGVSYANDDSGVMFTHTIYKNDTFNSSFTLGGLDIFKEKLNIVSLVRSKINFLYRTAEIIEHHSHTDLHNPPNDLKTAILYLNTNNGYTKFKTGEKIDSIENRLITFDGKLEHYGTTNSCDAPYRVVFNLNYF